MIFLILLCFFNILSMFNSFKWLTLKNNAEQIKEIYDNEEDLITSVTENIHKNEPFSSKISEKDIKKFIQEMKINNQEKYNKLKAQHKKEKRQKDAKIDLFINKKINGPTVFDNIEKSIDNTFGKNATKTLLTLTISYAVFEILKKIINKKFNNIPEHDDDKKRIISFKDIAGYKIIKEELEDIIEFEVYNTKNKKMTGILFYGPTGTGKTLFAQAFATEAQLPLIITDSTMLQSKWVGETEKNIKKLFINAKKKRPCVIFIDEIDTLLGTRKESDPEYAISAKNAFSSFMDSSQDMSGIVFIGATNRLESIDPIFKRPGRLGHHILIDNPKAEDRKEIIMYLLKKNEFTLDHDINMNMIIEKTNGLSPAELTNLISYCEQIIIKTHNKKIKGVRKITNNTQIKNKKTDSIKQVISLSIFEQALVLVMKSHNSSKVANFTPKINITF